MSVPSTALHGGIDMDGSEIFVGRAFHEGDWLPAKVIPSKQVSYICYNGEEHAKHQFQVILNRLLLTTLTSVGYLVLKSSKS